MFIQFLHTFILFLRELETLYLNCWRLAEDYRRCRMLIVGWLYGHELLASMLVSRGSRSGEQLALCFYVPCQRDRQTEPETWLTFDTNNSFRARSRHEQTVYFLESAPVKLTWDWMWMHLLKLKLWTTKTDIGGIVGMQKNYKELLFLNIADTSA